MHSLQAIGVVETCGMPAAIIAADLLEKGANVQVIGLENTDSGRISVLIRGKTGAVNLAIQSAFSTLRDHPGMTILGCHVIPCPDSSNLTSLLKARRRRSSSDSVEWLDD